MRHPTYATQTKARKRALDILFEAELRDRSLDDTLVEHSTRAEPVVRAFTETLVRGVDEHLGEIDERIREATSADWPIERMPRVDRNLARIAVFELDFTETPGEVIIAEIVKLAAELSTDDSPSFLNGLLAKAMATRKTDH